MNSIKLIFLSIIIISSFSLFSQENKVAVSIKASSENEESLQDVIIETVTIEFEVAGYEISNENDSFQVLCKYSVNQNILDITLECFSFITSEKILSSTNKARIDLDLDLIIQNVTLDLISQLDDLIKNNPDLIRQPEVEVVEPVIVDEPEISDFKKLSFSISVASFLTTGDASGYFKNGIKPELNITYRFEQDFGYFYTGVNTSINIFKAQGILYSSENMLISAGPVFGIGINTNSMVDITAFISSGMTMFRINSESKVEDSTFIPYLSGGLGFNADISSNFALSIKAGYDVYFEESVLITGFSPSVGITVYI